MDLVYVTTYAFEFALVLVLDIKFDLGQHWLFVKPPQGIFSRV